MGNQTESQQELSASEILSAKVNALNEPLTALSVKCRIDYQRFYRIIKGISVPTFDEAVQIQKALGIDVGL